MQRKDFICQASLSALAMSAVPDFLFKSKKKIGLQLYSVQNAMELKTEETLAQIAKIGYNDLESSAYTEGLFYRKKPAAFRKMLISEGLTMSSGHIKLGSDYDKEKGTMYNEWERAIADAMAVGQSYLVLGWVPPEYRRNINDYKRLAHQLNICGELCQKYGVKMVYHNHDFEFQVSETLVPYDILLRYTETDLVAFELDLYWATKGGVNPIKIIEKNLNRFPLLTLKDMDKTPERNAEVLGKGSVDFTTILSYQKQAGVKRLFIEQEPTTDSMKNIETSFKYLRQIL